MSHDATAWAFSIRGLSAGEFRVLVVLADCHNPERGCFPSGEYLRKCCEMSNGALYENLQKLEEKGHIRRVKRGDIGGNGRAPTRYILGFEGPQIPDSGVKPDSGQPELAPTQIPAHRRPDSGPPETEPVREPVNKKEQVKTREALVRVLSDQAADAFIAHRKAKRAKLTEHAAQLIARKLETHPDPDSVVFESIANGWTGVFPKNVNTGGNRDGSAADRAVRAAERWAARHGARSMDFGEDRNPSQPLLPARQPFGSPGRRD